MRLLAFLLPLFSVLNAAVDWTQAFDGNVELQCKASNEFELTFNEVNDNGKIVNLEDFKVGNCNVGAGNLTVDKVGNVNTVTGDYGTCVSGDVGGVVSFLTYYQIPGTNVKLYIEKVKLSLRCLTATQSIFTVEYTFDKLVYSTAAPTPTNVPVFYQWFSNTVKVAVVGNAAYGLVDTDSQIRTFLSIHLETILNNNDDAKEGDIRSNPYVELDIAEITDVGHTTENPDFNCASFHAEANEEFKTAVGCQTGGDGTNVPAGNTVKLLSVEIWLLYEYPVPSEETINGHFLDSMLEATQADNNLSALATLESELDPSVNPPTKDDLFNNFEVVVSLAIMGDNETPVTNDDDIFAILNNELSPFFLDDSQIESVTTTELEDKLIDIITDDDHTAESPNFDCAALHSTWSVAKDAQLGCEEGEDGTQPEADLTAKVIQVKISITTTSAISTQTAEDKITDALVAMNESGNDNVGTLVTLEDEIEGKLEAVVIVRLDALDFGPDFEVKAYDDNLLDNSSASLIDPDNKDWASGERVFLKFINKNWEAMPTFSWHLKSCVIFENSDPDNLKFDIYNYATSNCEEQFTDLNIDWTVTSSTNYSWYVNYLLFLFDASKDNTLVFRCDIELCDYSNYSSNCSTHMSNC